MNKENITLGIIIDTDIVIPPNTGVTYRLYYLSKKLVEKGITVKLFICNRSIESIEDLKKLFSESNIEIHIIPQNVFYNLAQMESLIGRARINILQFEDPVYALRFSRISSNLKIPVCLEMHDVEATLAEKLGLKNSEINLSKAITIEAVNWCHKIICMTETDKQELVELIKVDPNKLTIVPNPIDINEFPYYGVNIESNNVIFIGNMFYWPNKNAAEFIIQQLYTRMKNSTDNPTFLLVGMVPKDIRELARGKKGIAVTGPLEKLDEILQKATLAVCPVLEGSGMKVKILNYSAAGLPIITTKIGASGYENIPSLIIEDDLEKYPELIAKLLLDKQKMIDIGKKNREFVEKNYDIDSIAEKMVAIYKELISQKHAFKEKYSFELAPEDLPLPLWTREKRIKKFDNSTYYVLKNRKVLYTGNIAKIFIVEGFWGVGKTTFINNYFKNDEFVLVPEPNHLSGGVKGNISQWYLTQHRKRLNLAKRFLSNGNSVVLERSTISNIAFYYAGKGNLPKWAEKELGHISLEKNLQVLFLYNSKKECIKNAPLHIKDKIVLDAIRNDSMFYDRYVYFYKTLLPKLIKNKSKNIKIAKEKPDLSTGLNVHPPLLKA
jgi:glycosyltransferase involved in cell wall biosynthesis